ncbi:MAG: D-aminoacyl-tRNA deacylase [Candidatus Kapaibacterium sp.]
MKAVVQRVSRARVSIGGSVAGEIDDGLVVLLGIACNDTDKEIEWMCNKIANLRVFPDDEGKMNRSAMDIGGGIMLISNFTIYGDPKKGFRPNFMAAAPPEISEPLYDRMVDFLRTNYPLDIATGEFGAMMDIEMTNAGPVTIILEKESE